MDVQAVDRHVTQSARPPVRVREVVLADETVNLDFQPHLIPNVQSAQAAPIELARQLAAHLGPRLQMADRDQRSLGCSWGSTRGGTRFNSRRRLSGAIGPSVIIRTPVCTWKEVDAEDSLRAISGSQRRHAPTAAASRHARGVRRTTNRIRCLQRIQSIGVSLS